MFPLWIHSPEECYSSNDCAFLCISCCWQCLAPSILLMYLGVYMWCIFPEFEYIKLYSVMDVNIFFFCNLCALAFSDMLLEWWEAGEVLKSGFLEGKKIKNSLFLCICIGRCKVSGKREGPEQWLRDTTSQFRKVCSALGETGQSGSNSDVTGLGSWGSGVSWRKGLKGKDHSFTTGNGVRCNTAAASVCVQVVESHGNPTHPPFPPAAASGCAPQEVGEDQFSQLSASCLQDCSPAL